MAKTVTLRINDDLLERFKNHAKKENRTLSNFLETAALRYIENIELIDEYEMQEILSNTVLMKSLKNGSEDVKNGRGQFVDI